MQSTAVITIRTEGDQVHLDCTFDPPAGSHKPDHLSHALAGMAMLAIVREIKGLQDHAISLR